MLGCWIASNVGHAILSIFYEKMPWAFVVPALYATLDSRSRMPRLMNIPKQSDRAHNDKEPKDGGSLPFQVAYPAMVTMCHWPLRSPIRKRRPVLPFSVFWRRRSIFFGSRL